MSPLYSIIIPVYNVESYLRECVDSILQQDFRDFEVILVDDGSSDGSGAICDSYALADVRVKVVHQTNGGPSYARNVGIRMAGGEYLVFIDGDDFIAFGSLKMIAAVIDGKSDVDVIVVRLVHYFDDSGETKSIYGEYQIDRIENHPSSSVLAYLMSDEIDTCWSASNYIYRRRLITDNKMFFTEKIFFEDLDWTPGVILCASSFAVFPGNYYYYRQQRSGSVLNVMNANKELDCYKACCKWIRFMMVSLIPEPERKFLLNRFINLYMRNLFRVCRYRGCEYERLYNYLQANDFILDLASTGKSRLVKWLYLLTGLSITVRLLDLRHRIIQLFPIK